MHTALLLNCTLEITSQPNSASGCINGSASYSITATSSGEEISYQWERSTNNGANWTNVPNGGNYAGGTTSNLIVSDLTAVMNNYRFRCKLETSCADEIISDWVLLTVNPLPTAVISGNPSICSGGEATLNIDLTGTAPWSVIYSDGTNSTVIDNINSSPHAFMVNPSSTTSYTIESVTDANGCSNTGSGTAYVYVLPQPVAPGLTKNPDASSVCTGQTLTVSAGSGSGGTGTVTDEFSFSVDNGSTWSSWSTSIPSFEAEAGTNLIRSRRTATASGCNESTYNVVSWTVVAQPAAPAITKIPDVSEVCEGQILTASTSAGSGGAGTTADEYSYSTNDGADWSSWSATVPAFDAVAGVNSIRSRRIAGGPGCNTSDYNTVSWTVVPQPQPPVLTRIPDEDEVCAGQVLTVSSSSGSGGTGTTTDEYSYSTNNGSSWSSWSTSVPSIAAVTGTNIIRSRRTATGTGCNESTYNTASWTVVDQPTAPDLTKDPNVSEVCAGQVLTVSTSAGSGGTGTTTDEYSYSTDNGSSWSSWSTSVPGFDAVTGTNIIRSRRTATGMGCNESTYNSVSWTVVDQPTAPGLTKDPNVSEVCAGQVLTVSTSAGSGGTGTTTDEYSYSTDNGSSWSSWSTSVPGFDAVTGTNIIRSRRTATGAGCNESTYNTASWTVVDQPTAPDLTKDPNVSEVCAGQVLTVSTAAGSGGTGTITDEYSYSTDNGSTWSSWSTSVPGFDAITGTNIIRSRRTATGTGCNESAYNSVSWTVVDQPGAPPLTKIPNVSEVCQGQLLTVSATSGSGGSGTISDEYRYSTSGGSSWSSWSTSLPSFDAVTGTNLVQSRRTANGTGCNESAYEEVSWIVNPIPGVSATPAAQDVCHDQPTTDIIFSSAVGGTIFNWTNDTPSIGLPSSGQGNIESFTAINTGNVPITANITVEPTASGCQGTEITVTITVFPSPTVEPVANLSYCHNAPGNAINFSSPVSGVTFSWTSTIDIGFGTSGSGDIAAFTASNSTNAPVTATISVIATANGCPGPAMTFDITVYPAPVVNPIDDQSYCNAEEADPINFSSPTGGGSITYNWTASHDIGFGTGGTGNISGYTATNNTNAPIVAVVGVTASANGCSGPLMTFMITVYPTPVINQLPDNEYCDGVVAEPLNFTSPTTGGSITYQWTSSANIGFGTSGTGSVPSYTASNETDAPIEALIEVSATMNGCNSPIMSFTITVYPTTYVNPMPNLVYCSAEDADEIIFSSNTQGGEITYSWTSTRDVGFGTSGQGNIPAYTATNPTTSPAVATITVLGTGNGCTGPSITFSITVNPIPTVSASPASQTICPGGSITTILITNPNSVSGTSFSWTRDNTDILYGMPASGSGTSISGSLNSTIPNTMQTTVFDITATSNACSSTTQVEVHVGNDQPPTITCRPPIVRNTNTGSCTYTVAGNELNPLSVQDNCPGFTVTNDYNNSNTLAGEVFPKGTTTIVWTVTNSGGDQASCTTSITVNDVQLPTLTCKPGSPFIRYTDQTDCHYTVEGNEFDPENVGDNCPGVVVTNNFNNSSTLAGAEIPRGSHIIRWTATDESGNTRECTITVMVIDNVPPVITYCPPNITVPCPDDIPAGNPSLVEAIDNCGAVTIEHYFDDFVNMGEIAGFCPDSVVRTYRVTDQSGNYTDCVQVILIDDNCGCDICDSNVPHFWVDLEAKCDSIWEVFDVQRQGQCCGGAHNERHVSFSVRLSPFSVGLFIEIDGATPAGWNYQVDCGEEVSLGDIICLEPGIYHTITVRKPGANRNDFRIGSVCGIIGTDDLVTRINCESEITISGVVESTIQYTDLTGGGQYLSYLNPPNGSFTTIFTADSLSPPVIKYLVTGAAPENPCTNESGMLMDTITVFVHDEIRLSIDPAFPVFCENDPKEIAAIVTPEGDNYQISWYNSIGELIHQGGVFLPPEPGAYTVVAEDIVSTLPCSSDTHDFTIEFIECSICPPDEYHCSQDDVMPFTTVTAFVEAGGIMNFPCEVPDANISLVEVLSTDETCPQFLTYRYMIWDICSNRDTCNVVIEINDVVPPSFMKPADITLYANSQCDYDSSPAITGFPYDLYDNCTMDLQPTYTDLNLAGHCAGAHIISRTWMLEDDCGNQAEPQIQIITILDTIAPTVLCPADIIETTLPLDVYNYVDLPFPTVFDNCSPNDSISVSWTMTGSTTGSGDGYIENPSLFYLGTTIITYEFVDDCGNVNSCSFSVMIIPVMPDIECPPNLISPNDPGLCSASLDPGDPSIYAGTPPVSWQWEMTGSTVASGFGFVAPIPFDFNVGVTTITYTATNMVGSMQCSYMVEVYDNELPTFDIPTELSFCVNNIITAEYDGMPEPWADIIPERPDWYLVQGTELDLINLYDNCCPEEDIIISWTITFSNGYPPVSGVGQPSQYDEDGNGTVDPIYLWGTNDFTFITHQITYWVEDCHGNATAPVSADIVIQPRPNVVKQNQP